MLRGRWLVIVLLVPWMGAVAGGMFWLRHQAFATYGTTQAQAEWNEWRASAEQQAAEGGPVRRRVPKSAEPPALVLMRDHFGACLGAALVAATGCFLVFLVLLRGALTAPGPRLE